MSEECVPGNRKTVDVFCCTTGSHPFTKIIIIPLYESHFMLSHMWHIQPIYLCSYNELILNNELYLNYECMKYFMVNAVQLQITDNRQNVFLLS